ncbi:MAG TPA: RNA methyltransferase, partial [Anaeromyxobacteraceae bacterium]
MTLLGDPRFILPGRRERIDRVVAGRTRTLIVVMEAFCDPQNVNAVLRTCEAFGVQEVHVVAGPQKPYERNRKISQNADKWLDVVRWRSSAECLDALHARGFTCYATHLGEGSRALGELSFAGEVALVFGNESRGVSEEALSRADARYVIPMRGFSQSLNVSVAVAVS